MKFVIGINVFAIKFLRLDQILGPEGKGKQTISKHPVQAVSYHCTYNHKLSPLVPTYSERFPYYWGLLLFQNAISTIDIPFGREHGTFGNPRKGFSSGNFSFHQLIAGEGT